MSINVTSQIYWTETIYWYAMFNKTKTVDNMKKSIIYRLISRFITFIVYSTTQFIYITFITIVDIVSETIYNTDISYI